MPIPTILPFRPLRAGLVLVLAASLALPSATGLAASNVPAGPFPSELPNLGDSSSIDMTPLAERRIGEEIMRQIRAAGDDLDDPETVEYLTQFGALLGAHAPPGYAASFEFFAVKAPSINAFAMPGGFIGVHTGLLIAAQSESEFGAVLGHEMGHVTQRHIARSLGNQRQATLVALGGLVLAILAARAGNDHAMEAAAAVGTGVAVQSQLNFSRDAEREADRVGFQMLQSAGFDVTGMVNFFGRLQQATRYYEGAAPAYLRTHPLTSERIADIQNRIGETRYRQRPDSPEFQLMRARLRVLQDESLQGVRDAKLFFEEQIRSGHISTVPAGRYGLALTLVRQRDFAGAQRELGQIRKLLPASVPMIEKFGVELAQLTGDKAGAVGLARTARDRHPQSRMLAAVYANALQQADRHDEAITYLRDQISLYRQEPRLYALLAESYAVKGNGLQQHKAMAENYFLRGNLRAALNQLQSARRAGGNDFYENSQIDARARELQALIVEREKSERESGRR